MKSAICVLLCALIVLAAAAGCSGKAPEAYEQSQEPFTAADVTDVTEGFETLGDYVDAVSSTNCSWFPVGSNGETVLTLNNPDGRVSVRIKTPDGTVLGAAEGETMDSLPGDLLSLSAVLTSIEWLNDQFSAIAPARGIGVGSSQEKVLSGYLRKSGEEMYTIKDLNAQADQQWIAEWAFVGGRFIQKGGFYDFDTIEYGWCELNGPDEWKEYYNLFYDLEDGKVVSIRLYIEGDEADQPQE